MKVVSVGEVWMILYAARSPISHGGDINRHQIDAESDILYVVMLIVWILRANIIRTALC